MCGGSPGLHPSPVGVVAALDTVLVPSQLGFPMLEMCRVGQEAPWASPSHIAIES